MKRYTFFLVIIFLFLVLKGYSQEDYDPNKDIQLYLDHSHYVPFCSGSNILINGNSRIEGKLSFTLEVSDNEDFSETLLAVNSSTFPVIVSLPTDFKTGFYFVRAKSRNHTSNSIQIFVKGVLDYAWVNSYTSSLNEINAKEEAYDVVLDSEGNIYMVGWFEGSIKFDSHVVTSKGLMDGFLVKFDPNGKALWVRQFGGRGNDNTYGVAVDDSLNIYIVGSFTESVIFGKDVIESKGHQDAFVCKYDKEGNEVWMAPGGGISKDLGSDIAIDRKGNVYLTGVFEKHASFQNNFIKSNGVADIFVCMYNSEGTIQWLKSFGGTKYDFARALDIDENNNIYITGWFKGNLEFAGKKLAAGDYHDILLVKMDSSGNEIWGKKAGGLLHDYGRGIDVNKGNIYITGSYNQIGIFDKHPSTTHSTLKSKGGQDIFVAKYDYHGNLKWAKGMGENHEDSGREIKVDDHGDIYVSGWYNSTTMRGITDSDIYLCKLNEKGKLLWEKMTGGSGEDYSRGFAADDSGNMYVVGNYQGEVSFGQENLLKSRGASDIFLSKVSCVDKEGKYVPVEFKCFPNPVDVNERLVIIRAIGSEREATVSLYDIFGRIMIQKPWNTKTGKLTLDLKGYKAGIYLVGIQSERGNFNTKIIIP